MTKINNFQDAETYFKTNHRSLKDVEDARFIIYKDRVVLRAYLTRYDSLDSDFVEFSGETISICINLLAICTHGMFHNIDTNIEVSRNRSCVSICGVKRSFKNLIPGNIRVFILHPSIKEALLSATRVV